MTPYQWMHMTGAVSKADVTLLQQTVVPFHLVTFRPFSYRLSLTRCRQTSAANTAKSSSSTKTFSALVLVLPALGIAHSCRTMSPMEGPLASIMMSSTALALSNLITKPSALAAVPFDLGMPRTPERAYLVLARARVIQPLDTVLASPVSH